MSDQCYVYRLFDAEGGLLYIGQTNNPARRLGDHVRGLDYATAGAPIARQSVTAYPTRAEARAAEAVAIRQEQPPLNTQHRGVQA